MALTDEQRSLLQLLLGGQGYDDIGSLLGVSSDEVRSRAREALREIGGADPDAQVQLSEYLLGKADPIGRADAVRHLQSDPEANALAERLVTQLRLLSPQADLPEIPAPKGGRAPAQPTPPAQPSPPDGAPPAPGRGAALSERIGGVVRGLGGGSKRRNQTVAAVAGVGVLVIIGVLAVAGVFGGGDDDSGGETETTATTASGAEGLTIVELTPLDGGSASGQAVFAQTQDQPVIQINLSGLQQAGQDQNYIVWLYSSARIAFPLARDQVGENGNLTGAAAIPNEIIPLLGQFGCIDVSLASNQETQQALQQAVEGQTLPQHSGQTVLRGEIPSAPGEPAPTGADSQCEQPAAPGAGGGAGGQGGAPQGGAGQ